MRWFRSSLARFLESVVLHPRRGRHLSVALFLLTSTSLLTLNGPRVALAALAIVLAHEMGHFIACRYHGVSSTWPLLLPAPILAPLPATFGAVMAIRSPFPNRRALFDIGIAGPLAGLAVTIPVLWMGFHEVTFGAAGSGGVYLGEPLAFRIFDHLVPLVAPAPGMEARLGPLGLAAWFGFLLTGLNLIPIGQLDGGHILHALFPRQARRISRAIWWASLPLIVLSTSWILWILLTRALLARPHPPTLDDQRPLGRGRQLLAFLALVALIVSFMPEPIVGSWAMLQDLLVPVWQSLTSG